MEVLFVCHHRICLPCVRQSVWHVELTLGYPDQAQAFVLHFLFCLTASPNGNLSWACYTEGQHFLARNVCLLVFQSLILKNTLFAKPQRDIFLSLLKWETTSFNNQNNKNCCSIMMGKNLGFALLPAFVAYSRHDVGNIDLVNKVWKATSFNWMAPAVIIIWSLVN